MHPSWEIFMRGTGVLFAAAAIVAFATASAAEETMTGADLTELLSGGKTIKLGGPGMGYSGELVLTADGKGKGEAETEDGKNTFVLEGTWEIKGDTFCRKWAAFDDGKEVCETWVMTEPNKVKVTV
ncbi:MAG: hypothetical protein QG597_4126, partial [Actinomycetota bacterium]|nr:hypothetical protein [Actinomycetota bacterium]